MIIFLSGSFIALILFKDLLLVRFVSLFTLYIFTVILFAIPFQIFVLNKLHMQQNVVVKLSDLFFQHSMFNLLVFIFLKLNMFTCSSIIPVGLFFFLVHTPLFFIKKVKMRVLFTVLSALGGTFFCFLILTFANGFIYAFLIHCAFYCTISFYNDQAMG